MHEQHRQLDDFFHNVSRYIFIIPVAAVLISIFFKLTTGSQQKGSLEYNISPTQFPSGIKVNPPDNSSPSAKFNLTGPLSCIFPGKTSSAEAYVKDKKVFIAKNDKNIKTNYLLNGDCVYIWKNGFYSGEKICGISQQVAIADGLLASGLINPETIFENLGKLFDLPAIEGKAEDLQTAAKICKNEAIPASINFGIPRNVLFKNKSLK